AQRWRLKPLHRLMVTSAIYRQSSHVPDLQHSALRTQHSALSTRDALSTGKQHSALSTQHSGLLKQSADDPENTLLWRMNRRRLEAESRGDAMLAASGELNLKMGGPGVLVPIEKEVEDLIFTEAEVVDLWPETPHPSEHARRSLYLFRKRNVRYPMF